MENFRRFKAFLEANGPFDIFIDGANIASFIKVARAMIAQGYV